jgi:hypothetical protein
MFNPAQCSLLTPRASVRYRLRPSF